MDNKVLTNILLNFKEIKYVNIDGDGYHHNLIIVADIFDNLSKVKRQQWVYEKLQEYIISGQLHAINIKTFTPLEWENHNGSI